MSRKFALVIGNTEYSDPGLMQLTAPGKDAEDFARVLQDQELCAFDEVHVLLNQLSSTTTEAVDEFFDQKKPDDLLVLYFSGHGVRDEFGSLFLAFKNTIRTRLRATAVKSEYIREAMDQSRSKRQVVILDCCNSGAFPQGTKAAIGGSMGMATAFQGYGRFVLMASDATQFAWEGDKLIGEARDSLFTHYLVKGLEGEADKDSDGIITVDELYDYAFEEICRVTTKQTPTKSASKVEGDLILRRIKRLEDIKPVLLPSDLKDEAEDTRPYVRGEAVRKLEKILRGKNLGLVRSALEALQAIAADENTTRRVALDAMQVLEAYRQKTEQPTWHGQKTVPNLEALAAPETEEPPAVAAELPEAHQDAAEPLPQAEQVTKAEAEPAVIEEPVAIEPVAAPSKAVEVQPEQFPTMILRRDDKAFKALASSPMAAPARAAGTRRAVLILGSAIVAAALLGIAFLIFRNPGGLQGLLNQRPPPQTAVIISTAPVFTPTTVPTIASAAPAHPTGSITATATRVAAATTAPAATASGVTVTKFQDHGGYFFRVNGGPYAGMLYGALPDGVCEVGPNGKFAIYVDQNGVVYGAHFGRQGLIRISQLQKKDFWALRNNQTPKWQLQINLNDNGTYTLVVSERSFGDDHVPVALPLSLTQ